MAQNIDYTRRSVIPRWRPYKEALQRGENVGAFSDSVSHDVGSDVLRYQQDWVAKRSIVTASEFLGAAVAASVPQLAVEAAEFLLRSPEPLDSCTLTFASAVLQHTLNENVDLSMNVRIHRLRKRLQAFPHDPYTWIDLALDYTSAGVLDKANLAVRAALQLAPMDRHILRAAVRFFVHVKDFERALQLVASSPATPFDPWLIAAEIAVSQALDRSTDLLKIGRTLAKGGDFSDMDLAELRSALGTLEVRSGSTREGKRYLAKSIISPTENAVAQVNWAVRELDLKEIDGLGRVRIESPEAYAWYEFDNQHWNSSLHHALKWIRDQPFSPTPSVFGSFVAGSMLDDYQGAIRICKNALIANHRHPLLLNNLAFYYLRSGELPGAETALAMLPNEISNENYNSTILATRGLYAYKKGNYSEGEHLYNEAINYFLQRRDYHLVAMATIFQMLARIECNLPISEKLKSQLLQSEKLTHNKEAIELLRKLRVEVATALE